MERQEELITDLNQTIAHRNQLLQELAEARQRIAELEQQVAEAQLAKEGEYLVGNALSYADFACFWILPKRLAILSEVDQAGFPLLTAWLERMKGVKGVTSAHAKGYPQGW